MLISPASKDPLLSVIRTLLSVAVSDFAPDPYPTVDVPSLLETIAKQVHVKALLFSKVTIAVPAYVEPANISGCRLKPDDIAAGELEILASALPAYPEVSNPPESPSCSSRAAVPLGETLLNITVTRFTPLGNPVKSMLVPLVEA